MRHNFALLKKQSRLHVRKYSFSERTINVWNKLGLSTVLVELCSRTEYTYLVKAGYT